MTVADTRPPASAPAAPVEPAIEPPHTLQCPFLTSPDGSWRAASAMRDHRCAAVTPPAPLTAEKQRRLCLTPDHQACATFLAAEAVSGALPGRTAGLPRPMARTTPVILDRKRFGAWLPPIVVDRTTGQLVLVAVLVVAILVVVVARMSGGGAAPAGSPSPHPSPSATARATPTATARATPTSTPRASAAATPAASPKASAASVPKTSTGSQLVGWSAASDPVALLERPLAGAAAPPVAPRGR